MGFAMGEIDTRVDDLACKVKGAHQHAGIATDRVSGLHTETATAHPVGAGFFAPGRDQLLFEVIYRALVIAQRAVNARTTFFDDRDIRRQHPTRAALTQAGNPEHDYQALLAILERAAEAHTYAVPVRTGHPFALRAGIIPVEFELERTVEAGPQKAIPGRQAFCGCDLCGRSILKQRLVSLKLASTCLPKMRNSTPVAD